MFEVNSVCITIDDLDIDLLTLTMLVVVLWVTAPSHMTSDLTDNDLVLSLSYRRSMAAKTGITVGRSQFLTVIMLPQNAVGISLEVL